MDLSSFEPAQLHASLARCGVLGEMTAHHRIDAAGDGPCWPIGPDRSADIRQARDREWPARPTNPILEKIFREGIPADRLADFLQEEKQKEARDREVVDFCISGNNRR